MLLIISPAKTLDFSADTRYTEVYTQPNLLDESQKLVKQLAKMQEAEIGELMHISDKLATLNYERYQQFSPPFHPQNAKQALTAFKGDVYQGFSLDTYDESDFTFAQIHLRILSGLYGLLKPLDLIQPYRLEMGTKLKTRRGKNLYEFWGDRITKALKQAMADAQTEVLVNLASNEYFKSVQAQKLNGRVITPIFKEEREGNLKIIAFYAKKARGMMSDFVIKNRLTAVEDLKHFREAGYEYIPDASTETQWVFARSNQ